MRSILCWTALPLAVLGGSLGASPFRLDSKASELTVHVRATAHSFDVAPDAFTAEIELGDSPETTRAKVHIPIAALHSGNESRDKEMSEWIEAAEFPEVTFALQSVTETDGQPIGHGRLTMHGITHEVEVPFTIGQRDGQRLIEGSAIVNYDSYGLKIIRKFFLKVHPELEIHFTLVEADTDESGH